MPTKKVSVSTATVTAEPEEPRQYDPTDPTIPGSPAYLQAVAKDAWERNHPEERPPAPPIKRWEVSYGDSWTTTVEAPNEADAWAVACDKLKKWPNRRTPGINIKQA